MGQLIQLPRGWQLLGVFVALLGSISCTYSTVYEEMHQLPNYGWTYAEPLAYPFQIEDTTAYYDLWLDLKHRPDLPYQNLYVQITTTYPKGQTATDVISLELADRTGRWYGNCSSDACALSIPLQRETFFDQSGVYHLQIEQYTRTDTLPALKAFGLRIEGTGKKR